MSRHQWARDSLERLLSEALHSGYGEELMLRAMLGVIIERSRQVRSEVDLAQELIFLADTLDADRDCRR